MKSEFTKSQYDAIVVGSGPNGLSCAITLAQKGLSTVVVEKSNVLGGSTQTRELTLPGFHHDVCSTVHPLAAASPFFKTLPLHEHGLKWIYPSAEVAHPHDDGSVTLLKRSVAETAKALGRDQKAYAHLFGSLVARFDDLMEDVLIPLLHAPRHLGPLIKFGLNALLPADALAKVHFREEKTRALLSGIAAHSSASLTAFASSSIGLALQTAGHGVGWPLAEGGSKNITRALVNYFKSLGGEIITNYEVQNLEALPKSDLVFFDLTPRQVLNVAGPRLPRGVFNSFKKYQYGPAVFKMDWALSEPIPWTNSDCRLAATVHLGGSSQEIIHSESSVNRGVMSARPFVLLTQPTLFDPTRAPSGLHIAWAYCHVPNSSSQNMSDIIENQIERFAPGFKKTILKRHSFFPRDLEAHNPNLVGGDISGGWVHGSQIFFRPRFGVNPYSLDGKRLWICSSSTPPGPGVHGMCGHNAAAAALRKGL
jgi:phytoene dehydrogenase-like protein